jgi:hypothetical protein
MDLSGLARQQQGGGIELRQDRRASDAVAAPEPGAIVDRGVDPASSQRDRLVPAKKGHTSPPVSQVRTRARGRMEDKIRSEFCLM